MSSMPFATDTNHTHLQLPCSLREDGECRMPSVFESDACDFETVIVQLLCLWWVECVVGMVLVTVEYLLCSYLVSEEMK